MAEHLLPPSHHYPIPQLVLSLTADPWSVVVVAVKEPVGCPSCFEGFEKGQTGEDELVRFVEIGRVENPLSQERTGSVSAASLVSFADMVILKDPELSLDPYVSGILNVNESAVNVEDVVSVIDVQGDVDVSDECKDLLCHNGQQNLKSHVG